MKRIAIVGCSGVGKSTLSGNLSSLLNLPVIELDSYFHQPNWTPTETEVFRREVFVAIESAEASSGGWISDGNYNSNGGGDVQARADTILWLDLPRRAVMSRVIRRTLFRVVTRQELWNGNRERWANLFKWKPEDNIIRWSWTQHANYRRQYSEKISSGEWSHAKVYRLHSASEVAAFVKEYASP